jgi:choline dehydrogenase-like flavoprotein
VTPSGTAFNAFVRLIRPELRAGRLEARFRSSVVRLEASGGRVHAVVFRDTRSGIEGRVPCRAVVLAGGAIGTPEILLASSSADFPEGLGNTHGIVGHYLHDHPLAKLVVDLRAPVTVHPATYLTRPSLDRAPPLYAAACMQWSGAQLVAKSLVARSPGRLPWLGFSVFGTMAPSKDDFVALDPTRRTSGASRAIRLNVRHPPESLAALEKARDDLTEALGRAGMEPRVRTWHVEAVGNSVHYGGSCRMHASPSFGVVDGWSRLHSVRNVAVADSSVFTTGPEKNPVLTAMALAARAADRLAAEMKSGDI